MTSVIRISALQQQVSSMAQPVAMGVIIAAAASGMSQFVQAGMAAMAGAEAQEKHSSAGAMRLAEVEEKLRKMEYVHEKLSEEVIGKRQHKIELMQEYGITVMPAIVIVKRNFPKLYITDKMLQDVEKNLASLDLRMMMLKKERKELRAKLGLTSAVQQEKDAIPKHAQYTQMKKFTMKSDAEKGIY